VNRPEICVGLDEDQEQRGVAPPASTTSAVIPIPQSIAGPDATFEENAVAGGNLVKWVNGALKLLSSTGHVRMLPLTGGPTQNGPAVMLGSATRIAALRVFGGNLFAGASAGPVTQAESRADAPSLAERVSLPPLVVPVDPNEVPEQFFLEQRREQRPMVLNGQPLLERRLRSPRDHEIIVDPTSVAGKARSNRAVADCCLGRTSTAAAELQANQSA
jgi:hypothetical protein